MKRNLLMLAVNLLLLLIGIFCFELIFGGWRDPLSMTQMVMLTNNDESYDISKFYDSPSGIMHLKTDAYGFRGRHTKPSQIDILTLGGSTTAQMLITEGKTWQDLLSKHFAQTGKKIYVANGGISGQSTHGILNDFDKRLTHIPKLKPKWFLFYVGLNDVYSVRNTASDALTKKNSLRKVISQKSIILRLNRFIKGVYFRYVRQRYRRRLILEDHEAKWTTTPLQPDHAVWMAPRLEQYAARLEALSKRARAMGAEPIFVTQKSEMYRIEDGTVWGLDEEYPSGDRMINGVDEYHIQQLINEQTLKTCRAMKGICLDLANELMFEPGDFYDYEHNTPAGAKKIAAYLYRNLKHLSF